MAGISPTYDNAQNGADPDFRYQAHLPPPTSVHAGISPPLKTSVRTGANLGAIVGDACQVYNSTISFGTPGKLTMCKRTAMRERGLRSEYAKPPQ